MWILAEITGRKLNPIACPSIYLVRVTRPVECHVGRLEYPGGNRDGEHTNGLYQITEGKRVTSGRIHGNSLCPFISEQSFMGMDSVRV